MNSAASNTHSRASLRAIKKKKRMKGGEKRDKPNKDFEGLQLLIAHLEQKLCMEAPTSFDHIRLMIESLHTTRKDGGNQVVPVRFLLL